MPKVGVGTTLGAGIFVTTAVVAAVSFVSDVRLARRSFIRDVLFFLATVLYLMACTVDGVITFLEAVGFIVIYVLFVLFVAGGRCISMLRERDEGDALSNDSEGSRPRGMSVGDILHTAAAEKSIMPVATESTSLLRSKGADKLSSASLSPADSQAIAVDRYRDSMRRQLDADIASLRTASYFAPDRDDGEVLDTVAQLRGDSSPMSRRQSSAGQRRMTRGFSIVDDLPSKPTKWTEAFSASSGLPVTRSSLGVGRASFSAGSSDQIEGPSGQQYLPFQMPRYHRKVLAQQLALRLAARGVAHEIVMQDGRTVNVAELALVDIELAAQTMAAAVTAEAARQGGAPLSFREAADVASRAAAAGEVDARSRGRAASSAALAIKPEDLLAVLPEETVRPVSSTYVALRDTFAGIGPGYSRFMHICEIPVNIARDLTIPLLHAGAYRRRLTALTLPFSFALLTLVVTTHILKGDAPTSIAGVPTFVFAGAAGALLALPLYLFGLPRKLSALENGALLDTGGDEVDNDENMHTCGLIAPLVRCIEGEPGEPMPTGFVFILLLLLSFVMSLVWLLLIANELVGTALCFGKVLRIPDTVMGLAVLAVGNSINDLAASVTIAREGYPSMAVAGAYAGPMFNVLAGIGLPMLIYTARAPSGSYNIGKDTPIVWAAFATLLVSLTATLIWVPLEGFRITHRIGRACEFAGGESCFFLCPLLTAFAPLLVLVFPFFNSTCLVLPLSLHCGRHGLQSIAFR